MKDALTKETGPFTFHMGLNGKFINLRSSRGTWDLQHADHVQKKNQKLAKQAEHLSQLMEGIKVIPILSKEIEEHVNMQEDIPGGGPSSQLYQE